MALGAWKKSVIWAIGNMSNGSNDESYSRNSIFRCLQEAQEVPEFHLNVNLHINSVGQTCNQLMSLRFISATMSRGCYMYRLTPSGRMLYDAIHDEMEDEGYSWTMDGERIRNILRTARREARLNPLPRHEHGRRVEYRPLNRHYAGYYRRVARRPVREHQRSRIQRTIPRRSSGLPNCSLADAYVQARDRRAREMNIAAT